MVITRISDFGLKFTQGSLSVAVNPPVDKKSADGGTFGADITLLSAPALGFDSAEHFDNKGKGFVISGPGEYERDDLFIYGLASTTNYGSGGINTVYYFNLDSIDVLILGAHEPDALPNEITELADNVDILVVPIAGDSVMGPVAANKLSTKLEAKVIIPIGATKETISKYLNVL